MKKINKGKKRINYDEILNKRIEVFIFLIFGIFSLIFIRVFDMMILNQKTYEKKLKTLSYNTVSGSSSPRGRIYDRNYKILVDNKAVKTITYKKSKNTTKEEMIKLAKKVVPYLKLDTHKLTNRNRKEYYLVKNKKYCLSLIKEEELQKLKQRKITNKELEELMLERIDLKRLNFSEEEESIAYLYYLMNKGYTYEEKIIKSEALDEEYAYITENIEEIDGFNTKIEWERVYPYGDTLKTILGKVSSSEQGLPKEEIEEYLKKGYKLNDRVGLSYIEKQYEKYLHGEKALYEVVNSHEIKEIKPGKRGKDIVLTIDIELQQEVENILKEEVKSAKKELNTEYFDHSSVVIQDPKTGEILAISSQKIVGDNVYDNTNSILISPITPGSVVKGASMLVGYQEGAIKIGEKMLDECVKVRGVKQKCSSVSNLGVINDITALAKSSNVYQFKTAIRVNGQEYFYDMKLNFNQLSFDKYRNMYHAFGLGVKTEIDLPIESSGYTSEDKAAGNLLDFVMGQYETYTPIQLSQYISTLANNGVRLAPRLLKEVHKSSETEELGEIDFVVEKKELNKIDVEEVYLNRVKEGFIAVLNSPGGYGVGYMSTNYKPAGKTGTSQSFLDTDNDGVIDTETITSSFIGYAPYDNPKMSIIITSPDSSHPNSSNNYASLVTYRISKRVTDAFNNKYNLSD